MNIPSEFSHCEKSRCLAKGVDATPLSVANKNLWR